MNRRKRYRKNGNGRKVSKTYNFLPINVRANAKANLALAQIEQIKGQINVESKFYDITALYTPVIAGAIVHLTPIAQGDSVSQRNGNQIKLQSVWARMYGWENVDATSPSFMRLIWFIDTEQRGSDPSVADVLESATPHSHMNFDNKKRFVILKDMVVNLSSVRGFDYEWFKKISIKCNYSSTTGASKIRHQLYFLHLSNDTTNPPQLYISHRTRYVDN